MEKQFFDNTKLAAYKACPRMYYLRHVRGWRPTGISNALIFGLCWHEAMDAVWIGYPKVKDGSLSKSDLVEIAMHAFEDKWISEGMKPISEMGIQDIEILNARTPMIAKEMIYNYIEARKNILDKAELVAAERPFAVPIYPDRNDVWYIGRRDKDIILDGDRIVIEHKTTSEYKIDGNFKSQYLESFYPNSQVEGYLYAANLEYGNVRYVWADAALVHKKVHDAFKFIPISASFTALDMWLWECRDWISRIQSELERLQDAQTEKILTAFPRNTEHCVGKYGLCGMLPICRGFENPAQCTEVPAGFIYEPWNPFDLLKIADIGITATGDSDA